MATINSNKLIDFLIAEQGYLWTAISIAGGGGVTLFLTSSTFTGKIFGFLGILLSIIFLNAFFTRRDKIVKMIKNLEEKE